MRKLLHPVIALATGALIVTTMAAPAEAAPEDRAAHWLVKQLNADHLIYNNQYDFTDYGLTADVVFALDYVGGHRGTVADSAASLAKNVDSWTTGVDFGSDDVYAGSVAKAVLVAQTAGRNPGKFGGVNLIKRLNARVSDTAPYVGRIEDKSEYGDYANTIGQAFAAAGLAEAGSNRAADVRRFLLKQQCSEGFFRLDFADKSQPRQGCDAGTAEESAPNTDVTALAVVLLETLPKQGKAVRRAMADAVSWLKDVQKRDGSFGGGTTTEGSNTNSTGLAAWALGESSACRAAVKAARWVRDLQVSGKVAGTPLAGEKGAIAYDRAAMEAAEARGITAETRDQWRRASSQAAPALTFTTLRRCRR